MASPYYSLHYTTTVLTFHVPPRFHPAYSLLGRGLRRRTGDARRAEALFLIVLSTLLLGVLLAQYFAWVWLKPAIEAAPLGPTAVAFWMSQVGMLAACLFTCVLGFTPAIAVSLTPTGLHLRRGKHEHVLPYNTITSAESISALLYYQHYARYAATQVFVNRMTPRVLLLHTPEAPFALGLPPDDHDTLLHLLEERLAPPFEPSIARVA